MAKSSRFERAEDLTSHLECLADDHDMMQGFAAMLRTPFWRTAT